MLSDCYIMMSLYHYTICLSYSRRSPDAGCSPCLTSDETLLAFYQTYNTITVCYYLIHMNIYIYIYTYMISSYWYLIYNNVTPS